MRRPYKRQKRGPIELTSLLDLLFTMIFISLIQQKEIVRPTEAPVKKERVEEVKPVKTLHSLSATFNFYPSEQTPNMPSGSYIMQGTFNAKNRSLSLGGVGWIERPRDYEMVPLSGSVDESGEIFTGRIEAMGCKTFTLKRVKKKDTTPISGEWKGTYDCLQGMTGLTLEIQ